MGECLKCKQTFPDDQLLLSARGGVCQGCMAQAGAETEISRGVWLTIFSGPGMAMAATGGLCLGPLGPFVGGALSLAALGSAARSIWCGWTYSHPEQYSTEYEPGKLEIGLLYGAGVITIPWALATLGLALLGFLAFFVPAAQGF